MNDERLKMMMLDIDGILTRYGADTTEVLAAAERMAVSAIGDLTNKTCHPSDISPQPSSLSPQPSESLHRAADAIAEQIRAALHTRILEGRKPDW
jgi:hypothetical protein